MIKMKHMVCGLILICINCFCGDNNIGVGNISYMVTGTNLLDSGSNNTIQINNSFNGLLTSSGKFKTDGGIIGKVNIQTATYTVLSTDENVIMNSSSVRTNFLPQGSANIVGQKYWFKNVGSVNCIIKPYSGDLIDGGTSTTLSPLQSAQLQYIFANNWILIK